jgi:hypothetical protein
MSYGDGSQLQAVNEDDTTKYVYSHTEPVPDAYPQHFQDAQKPVTRGAICGIPPLLFILMFALVILALAGSIGGGVAGSMASKECRSELNALKSKGPTGTTSNTASPTPSGTGEPATLEVPDTGCPDANGTTYTATFGGSQNSTTFVKLCNASKTGGDMFQIQTPSWTACMDACAEYASFFASLEAKGSLPTCAGVSWVPEWTLHPEYSTGNYSWAKGSCWLKSSMVGWKDGWRTGGEVVSGVVLV